MKPLITMLLVLTMTSVALADLNDTCDDAWYLIDQGFTAFDVDLCEYTNDYEGCGDMMASGPDAVWRALVGAGDDIELIATTDGDFQVVMYLVTDCGDTVGSCVISSDGETNVQEIDWVVTESNLYFLVIDSVQGCGSVHVQMGGVLANQNSSWSDVKALY